MNQNEKTEEQVAPGDIAMLDGLIKKYYDKILSNNKIEIKLGELLKMIELRRKLAPEDENQKDFWKMLEEIRKENLSPTSSKTKCGRPRKKKSVRAGK